MRFAAAAALLLLAVSAAAAALSQHDDGVGLPPQALAALEMLQTGAHAKGVKGIPLGSGPAFVGAFNTDRNKIYDLTDIADRVMLIPREGDADDGVKMPAVLLSNKDGDGRPIDSECLLILAHGNAGDLGSDFTDLVEIYIDLFGCHGLAFEYSGYPYYRGRDPNQDNVEADMDLILDFAITKLNVPARRIILVGVSIGTGIVAYGAAKQAAKGYPVGGLVLQGAFYSVNQLYRHTVSRARNPVLGFFAGWIGAGITSWWNIETYIEALKPAVLEDGSKARTTAVLFLHGQRDDLCLKADTLDVLVAAAQASGVPHHTMLITGAGHTEELTWATTWLASRGGGGDDDDDDEKSDDNEHLEDDETPEQAFANKCHASFEKWMALFRGGLKKVTANEARDIATKKSTRSRMYPLLGGSILTARARYLATKKEVATLMETDTAHPNPMSGGIVGASGGVSKGISGAISGGGKRRVPPRG